MGGVVASLDNDNVQRGDMVVYKLTLSGSEIARPVINTLCGQNVISTSAQTNIQMINGNTSKNYTLTYKFMPQESCEIQAIEVEIDGVVELSNKVKLKVSKQVVTKDSPFILTLELDKKQVFLGEPFTMTLLFKQRNNAEAVDSEFVEPKLNGFWIKEQGKSQRYKEGEYTITKKVYKLAAQRVGELKISGAQMRIASRSHVRDSWGGWIPQIKWKTYYSNELSIGVKAVPAGLSLVGDFEISAEIDKKSIKANEAVNVSIRVVGDGNLEDIQSFKPNLDGVNVFDEKISIVDGVLMQKMAFVSDRDFEIPSFSLKYFDTKSAEVKTIQTRPYSIKVKNAKPVQEKLNIKRDKSDVKVNSTETTYTMSNITALIIFLSGLVLGVLLAGFKPSKKSKKTKKLNVKDEKKLLVKFLPYKDDVEVQKILDILEANIYSDVKQVVDKKVLKELIMRYKIS